MKKIFFLVVAIVATAILNAQEPLVNTTPGTIFEYTTVNEKGKHISPVTQEKIISVLPKSGGLEVKLEISRVGSKGKLTHYSSPAVLIKDGKIKYDKNTLVPSEITGNKNLTTMVFGEGPTYPNEMNVNDALPPYKVSIISSQGNESITMEFKANDRRCVAIEEITVSAGTFTCFVIEEIIEMSISAGDYSETTPMKTKSWMAPGIGTVKDESYSTSEAFLEGSELIKIIAPDPDSVD